MKHPDNSWAGCDHRGSADRLRFEPELTGCWTVPAGRSSLPTLSLKREPFPFSWGGSGFFRAFLGRPFES